MQRIKALIAMLCILTLQGCLNSHGTSQIRGGSKGSFVNGSLSTLDLQLPVDEVVVAVVYPRPVDMNWFDGTASGTGGVAGVGALELTHIFGSLRRIL